ncbi:hypothetical protein KBD18_02600 [Patescibacteria group bacterium]|nr:hypothetical protein [Patescibacteria group bacterium]
MGDAFQYQRDLERERSHARALPPTLPIRSATTQDQQSARRELDADRLARVVDDALKEYAPANRKKPSATMVDENKAEEAAWGLFWSGLRKGLQIFFSVTFFTIVIPALLAPLIFLFYFVPLFWVNFLNDGKPVRFPIFGITGLITELKHAEVPFGAGWVLGAMLSMLVVTILLFALYAMLSNVNDLCSFSSTFCSLLPKRP